MQICISPQTDNHASIQPLSFFTGRMPFLPPNQTISCLINSFAISAHWIITGVKWLDKVRNTTVLASASWQHLIRTLQARQLKFLWHFIRSENQYMLSINHYKETPDDGSLASTTSITSTSWQDVTPLNCRSWHRTGHGYLARTCGQVVWPTATRLERDKATDWQNVHFKMPISR